MALYSRELFEKMLQQSGPVAFREIVGAVEQGTCNLFMGAAVHAAPPKDHSVYRMERAKLPPIGEGLAKALATDPEYQKLFPNDDTTNLARVAQTYESLYDRAKLVAKVTELVETDKVPSAVLRGLAELDFPVIVTTNYDTLFERALGLAGKLADVSPYHSNEDIQLPTPTRDTILSKVKPRNPFLYKMHGDIRTGESLVLTDEDYIQFILRMRDSDPLHAIPNVVVESIKSAPTLFIGYSLRDYNLRVVLKRLRQIVGKANVPATYAIDLVPDILIWDVWYNQRRFVNFLALDVWEFVPRLYRAVKGKDMPA